MGVSMLSALPSIAQHGAPLGAPTQVATRVFLSTRHSFRRWATNAEGIDEPTKIAYRTFELPKFIWVVELHDLSLFQRGNPKTKSRLGEVILDASADALHGDALIFARISGLMISRAAPDDGLLIMESGSQGGGRELLVIKAPPTDGQTEPWK